MSLEKVFFYDSATLAFNPLIDLSNSPFASLSSQAVIHWLEQETTPSQWGAFMHFYGATRLLLKGGGLQNEDSNFQQLRSENQKWNELTKNYLNGNLNAQEKLYFVRLLYYLGFYNNGIEICQNIVTLENDLEIKLWSLYLNVLGNSLQEPLRWSITPLIENIKDLQPHMSIQLQFHIYLLFAKFFIRRQRNAIEAKIWLEKTALLIQNSELMTSMNDFHLASLRLDKYKADLCLMYGDEKSAQKLWSSALQKIEKILIENGLTSSFQYLFKEIYRRIIDASLLHYFYKKNDALKAIELAQKAIQVDPFCSYAHLLAGEVNKGINIKDANHSYERAAFFGILERPYAKQMLAIYRYPSYNDSSSDKQSIDDKKDEKIPIELATLQNLAKTFSEYDCWELLKKNNTYNRFLPFFELKEPAIESPIFCEGPIVALEDFRRQKLPWFQTLYLQRAMVNNFREELFFAVSPHPYFSQVENEKAKSLEILQNRSEETKQLFATYQMIDKLPKLERILFCRLLGSLGFYHEALKSLPKVDRNNHWEIEDEYAFSTKIFFENIYFLGSPNFPYQDIEFAFGKMSSKIESLRMRLVLSMLASVYHGKEKNIAELKIWRDRGFEVLHQIQNIQEFDDFEKQLLTSRFYRAVCFLPFLTGDKDKLRKEIEICESYARNLTPGNKSKFQTLLYRENLFPMLETKARIFQYLGESEIALDSMEEIVFKVDPFDTKAWIQVGELREKNGDLEKALEAFQTAGNLGAPLGGLAWYRAGRASEKMEDLLWAKHCYMQSLQLCPKGLSPLKRLEAIAKIEGDCYLKSWCSINLEALKKHFKA